MFKRTKGYLLLTMLVLTGLAGRLQSDTLSGKERHYLVKELKTSGSAFEKVIDGLSDKQLNFKTVKNTLSIKDCIYQLVSIENSLWNAAKTSLQQETNIVQKSNINDAALTSFVEYLPLPYKKLKFSNVKGALHLFKQERKDILRYINTSTENARIHVVATPVGNFDAYQLLLLNAIYTNYYMQQIEKIKSIHNFPE